MLRKGSGPLRNEWTFNSYNYLKTQYQTANIYVVYQSIHMKPSSTAWIYISTLHENSSKKEVVWVINRPNIDISHIRFDYKYKIKIMADYSLWNNRWRRWWWPGWFCIVMILWCQSI